MTISMFIITGNPQQCEAKTCSKQLLTGPNMSYEYEDFKFELYEYLRDHFDNYHQSCDPLYWRKRIVTQMIATPEIISMSFVPNPNINGIHTLFMQKMGFFQRPQGFIAPYLPETSRIRWGATTLEDPFKISTMEMVNSTIDWLKGGKLHTNIQNILTFFLNDQLTDFMSLTFLLDPHFPPLTLGWKKA